MSAVLGIKLDRDCRYDAKRAASVLQHRGDEYGGFAYLSENSIKREIEKGKIIPLLKREEANIGAINEIIIHLSQKDAQPVKIEETRMGPMSLIFDGKITNQEKIRERYPYLTGTDAEIIIRIIASGKDPLNGIKKVYQIIEGPFCLILLTLDGIFAARDILGMRPLTTGRFLGKDEGKVGCAVASESAALKHIGMKIIRDIYPGEIVEIEITGFRSLERIYSPDLIICGFEPGYWGRVSSVIDGISAWKTRYGSGMRLGPFCPEGDIITGIPISGDTVAQGLHFATRIPFRSVFDYNLEAGGRSFLPYEAKDRFERAGNKLVMINEAVFDILDPEMVMGLKVIVADDSVVEGNQTLRRIYLIKEAGAKWVSLVVETPLMKYPCIFDITKRGELMAATHSLEDMKRKLGLEEIVFQSTEAYRDSVISAQNKERLESNPITEKNICLGCFTGEFPKY